MIDRLSHEDGISAIMNTHYPTNAMSVADEAFMMKSQRHFFLRQHGEGSDRKEYFRVL